MANDRQPFKVWSADRKTRKAVVVSSLQELIEKGHERLQLSLPVEKVVLEEDGTEVEDEDYFRFLEKNTTFLLLKQGESWTSPLLYDRQVDHVDGDSDDDVSDCPYDDLSSSGEGWRTAARILRHNVASIVTLSDQQLAELVSADESQLRHVMGCSLAEVESIQLTGQRYLDDREEAREAKALLQLMSDSRGLNLPNMASGDALGAAGAKRQKTDT